MRISPDVLRSGGDSISRGIHPNPVHAHVVPIEKLRTYRFGSYWFLHHPKERPARLKLDTALETAGDLPDSPAGRKSYAQYFD